MAAKAYYDERDRCWYVPMAPGLLAEQRSVEPVRLELKDGQLWITLLEPSAVSGHDSAESPGGFGRATRATTSERGTA